MKIKLIPPVSENDIFVQDYTAKEQTFNEYLFSSAQLMILALVTPLDLKCEGCMTQGTFPW